MCAAFCDESARPAQSNTMFANARRSCPDTPRPGRVVWNPTRGRRAAASYFFFATSRGRFLTPLSQPLLRRCLLAAAVFAAAFFTGPFRWRLLAAVFRSDLAPLLRASDADRDACSGSSPSYRSRSSRAFPHSCIVVRPSPTPLANVAMDVLVRVVGIDAHGAGTCYVVATRRDSEPKKVGLISPTRASPSSSARP